MGKNIKPLCEYVVKGGILAVFLDETSQHHFAIFEFKITY